jgi:hypothetical protein
MAGLLSKVKLIGHKVAGYRLFLQHRQYQT